MVSPAGDKKNEKLFSKWVVFRNQWSSSNILKRNNKKSIIKRTVVWWL